MIIFFIFCSIPLIAMGEDTEPCMRPKLILDFEETCKTDPEVTGNTGSFLEQVQENIAAAMEQTKRIFNMARKKLGIKYEETNTEDKMKKCEYYQCIFRKMDSLGMKDFPNMTLVQNWVNQNVDEDSKNIALVKVNSCFNALAMNIATDEVPSTVMDDTGNIKIILPVNTENASDYGMEMPLEETVKIKSACELSSKLMMCLNTDTMCSVFKYP